MAPEVMRDTAGCYSESSDVFGFAMTLYEYATGSIPFRDVVFNTIVEEKVLNGERPPMDGEIFRDIPELVRIVRDSWDDSPNMR